MRLLLVSLLAVAAGCDGPPPPLTPSFAVYGVVTTADGPPLADAAVDVRSYPGPCASADTTGPGRADGFARTDAAGRYRVVVESLVVGPVEGECVAVRAGRGDAVTQGRPVGATLSDGPVEARFELPLDSLRIDVRAPAR